jgi:pyridoxal phosphate enzyme (YggS family)
LSAAHSQAEGWGKVNFRAASPAHKGHFVVDARVYDSSLLVRSRPLATCDEVAKRRRRDARIAVTMDDALFAANLEQVRERMAAAAARSERDVDQITLIAVTAGVLMDPICVARRAGILHFSESLVVDWEDKRAGLGTIGAIWHFAGQLRSHDAKRAAQLFDRVDSLDSLSVARELSDAAGGRSFRLEVLIEVNLSGDARLRGVSEADLPGLAEAVVSMPNLELVGLMTTPPHFENMEEGRPFFVRLREVLDDLAERMDWPLRVLSMGTSRNFEIAIEEGATEIRVGKALFGEQKI